MKTLDRYILRGLTVNYLIAIAVMMSLYIVLDMFFNIDEFTEGGTFGRALADIGSFYGNRVFLYFAQLSGVITLFACLITVARMRRANELTAMLASGVSLYRVAAPVLVFALVTTGLWYVDTEVIVPSIAHKLARKHDDARGLKTYGVWFLNDRDGNLLSAQQYLPTEQVLKRVLVMKFGAQGTIESIIEADQASWEPTPEGPTRGRWILERGLERRRQSPAADAMLTESRLLPQFVRAHESDLDPRTIQMRQSAGWIRFLSSSRLAELEHQLSGQFLEQIKQARHGRFATPLVNLLMLLLGLPFIFDRLPGNLLADAGRCLVLCGSCFLASFLSQSLTFAPHWSALPAWLPIIVYTPLAAILLDRVRT